MAVVGVVCLLERDRAEAPPSDLSIVGAGEENWGILDLDQDHVEEDSVGCGLFLGV